MKLLLIFNHLEILNKTKRPMPIEIVPRKKFIEINLLKKKG